MAVEKLARIYESLTPALTAGPAPEFLSDAWLELPEGDPRREVAVWRAATAYWMAAVAERAAMAQASRAVSAAGWGIWDRLAQDRISGEPQGRARSIYPPLDGAA